MSSMTLYVPRQSIIHQMDPITKFLYVFVSISVTYIYPKLTFVLAVMAFSIILLILGEVFKRILPIIAVSFILIISIIIVQGIFHPNNETIVFHISAIPFYKEGLMYASLLTTRVINMLCSFGVLILTTKPDELVERFIRKGLSPKIGYVFLSIFQLIPHMQATMKKITDAQRSRGMETEGNLFVRMKAFFPLIGPVVLNSLNDTRERAIAIEMRGFNQKNKRTFINQPKVYKYQGPLNILLILIFLGTIFWRVFLWQ